MSRPTSTSTSPASAARYAWPPPAATNFGASLPVCATDGSAPKPRRSRPKRPPSPDLCRPRLAHQRPGRSGHAVGKRHRNQHLRLARQHPRTPRALGHTLARRTSNDRNGTYDQQTSGILLAHPLCSAEPVPAGARMLPRRQATPSREVAAFQERFHGGANVAIVAAVIKPTPGIVISHRAVSSVFERRRSLISRPAILSFESAIGPGSLRKALHRQAGSV